jgi:hypothetical protein
MRANHDTFHNRKSVHELNSEGIKDETREEKHSSDLGVGKRGSSWGWSFSGRLSFIGLRLNTSLLVGT